MLDLIWYGIAFGGIGAFYLFLRYLEVMCDKRFKA